MAAPTDQAAEKIRDASIACRSGMDRDRSPRIGRPGFGLPDAGWREADWREAVGGFGVQYFGADYDAPTLAAAPHPLLILEPALLGPADSPDGVESFWTAAQVDAIGRRGCRPVFAYLNLGEASDYRDYWITAFGPGRRENGALSNTDKPPSWLGGWHDGRERLAAFWSRSWEMEMRARLDRLLALGFDGVFMDDVLHYYTWGARRAFIADFDFDAMTDAEAPRTTAESARAMMRLVIGLAEYARRDSPRARPDFGVIVNGGGYIYWDARSDTAAPAEIDTLFAAYLAAIDAVVQESMLGVTPDRGLIRMFRERFVGNGAPVLTIDFRSRNLDASAEELDDLIRRQAMQYRFIPYLADDERFDRLYPPISLRR